MHVILTGEKLNEKTTKVSSNSPGPSSLNILQTLSLSTINVLMLKYMVEGVLCGTVTTFHLSSIG